MSKSTKANVTQASKRASKKLVSHGTYRADRKPNSKLVK
jgi:hypothetical protein